MPRVESDDSAHPHNQDVNLALPPNTHFETSDNKQNTIKLFSAVQDNNGETTSGSKDGEKCISPIGAGLPLLSRLKLLKEKQVNIDKSAVPLGSRFSNLRI